MRARQLLPLSGVVAVVLIFFSFLIAGEPPDLDAPNSEIVSYYADNDDELKIAAPLLALGSFFLLIFSAAIASLVRGVRRETAPSANVTLAGGIMIAVGMTIFAGIAFSAAEAVDDLGPAALETFHALEMNMFFPLAVGVAAFLLGAGVGTLRTDALPAWLSWAAIVLGVLAISPAGFFAFLAMGVWMLIVSVLLFLRGRSAPEQTAPGTTSV
jgi:hypothetical protein